MYNYTYATLFLFFLIQNKEPEHLNNSTSNFARWMMEVVEKRDPGVCDGKTTNNFLILLTKRYSNSTSARLCLVIIYGNICI